MNKVPAFLLITWTNTWTHFKNLKVRLGRPTNWMQRSDHSTSLNRGLSRKSELKRYCLLNNNHGLEGCIRDPGFDRNIFNLRYGEQYNDPISAPLNQTVIVWSVLYSCGHRQRLQSFKGPKKSEQEKEARESWLGKRERRNPPLCLFVSSSGERR